MKKTAKHIILLIYRWDAMNTGTGCLYSKKGHSIKYCNQFWLDEAWNRQFNPGKEAEQEKLTALQLHGWTIVRDSPLKQLGTVVQKDNEFWFYEFGSRTESSTHFTIDQAYNRQFKKQTT